MNGVAYQRVREVFHQLCDAPLASRGDALAHACGDDRALRLEVEALLAAQERAGPFLERPAPEAVVIGCATEAASGAPTGAPSSIGRYRVVRLIAEGGMGSVYEAAQESPDRTVAVKVIRPGAISGRLLRRFEHEAQLLGRLQHPGIAQIHEAGVADVTWPDGSVSRQPFFAMELVDGAVLTEWARAKPVRERLVALARLCDGVQHGHQRGVIHRDLKPANILVASSDGQPKIIDYGVARRIDAGGPTRDTAAGQMIGTLAYMSPEQLSGDTALVDTRADVYSLGVIGYELLAGRLPHDLGDRGLPESAAILRDREPPALSSVDRSLKGDLETIIAKAMEKDPSRRYQSASDLAADLRRFLAFEPIAARPATMVYQLRRFARRHRGIAAGAALATAGLVIGTLAAVSQTVATARQRDRAVAAEAGAVAAAARATSEAETAERRARCLEAVFAALTPPAGLTMGSVVAGPATTRAVLERSAETIAQELSARPLEQAALLDRVGEAYTALGLYGRARTVLESALAIRQRAGPPSRETAQTLASLAWLSYVQDDTARAIDLYKQALILVRAGGADAKVLAEMNSALAIMLHRQGRLVEAELPIRESLQFWLSRPEFARNAASALTVLAGIREASGDTVGASGLLAQSASLCGEGVDGASFRAGSLMRLERLKRAMGDAPAADRLLLDVQAAWMGVPTPLDTQDAVRAGGIGSMLSSEGLHPLAESYLRLSKDALRRLLGEDAPGTVDAAMRLGTDLQEQGRFAEAQAEYREALRTLRRLAGDEHTDVGTCLLRLAQMGDATHDEGLLEELAREAGSLRRTAAALHPDHPHRSGAALLEGYVALARGDAAGAEPALRECVALRERLLGAEHRMTAYARTVLGASLVAQGRFDEAEPMLRASVPLVESFYGPHSFMTTEARSRLADLYAAMRQPEKAAAWR